MRVLVAGRNAGVLAKAAGTFANDLEISTATTQADCFALLANSDFDLIIACETLADGPGLEVLNHVVVNTPNTLRIFAARPATLDLLKGELGFFGLFRTLPYPINFRKLWAAISLARGVCDEQAPMPGPAPSPLSAVPMPLPTPGPLSAVPGPVPAPGPLSAVPGPMSAPGLLSAAQGSAPQESVLHGSAPPAGRHPSPAPLIRHVVLEDTWEIEALSAHGEQQQSQPQQQAPTPQHQPLTELHDVTPGMRAAARYAAAFSAFDAATPPARIPESESFKRARARRNAANRDPANHNAANRDAPNRNADKRDAANRNAAKRDSANHNASKREPIISNHTLAEIAKRFAITRPLAQFGRAPAGIRRAVLFIGSGALAAIALAVLTYFLANTNKSTKPAKLTMIASMNQPLPHKVFPWQPETQQPTRQAAASMSEASPAAVADIEAKAEAAAETPDGNPDQAPVGSPPPSEPQSPESPAQTVNQ